jgi:hypothetical protein
MEDTACKERCAFVKAGVCKSCEDCPNYVESWWNQKDGPPRLIRDCAPKRIMLQVCRLETEFVSVQGAAEEARNHAVLMNAHFTALVDATKSAIEEQKQLDAMSRELAAERKDKLMLEKKD